MRSPAVVLALAVSTATLSGCGVEPRPPAAPGGDSLPTADGPTADGPTATLVTEVTDLLERYAAATAARDTGGFRFGGLILFVLERGEDGWRIVGGQAS